jgi:tetratricopeptide (TPR) repeat protein
MTAKKTVLRPFTAIFAQKRFLFVPMVLLVFLKGTAQEIPQAFLMTTDSIIGAAPKTYRELDAVLRDNRRDTLLMRYFTNSCLKANYLDGASYGFNQLGTKYRNISYYTKAISLHQKALDAAEKADNLEFRVFSLNMLGVAYRKKDAIKTALDYNQEALELAESVKDPSDGLKRGINVSLNSIGNLYHILNQYDLAIAHFKKSMELEKELDNTLGLAINHQNIGEAQEAKGELTEALHSYRTSLAYNEEINSDIGKLICKNSIAQVYIKQNKGDKALELLKTIEEPSEALGDKHISSSVKLNLGMAQMQLGLYSEAEVKLKEGLDLSHQYDIPSNISLGYQYLSDLYQYKGDYKTALEFSKKADKFQEEITNERNLRYVNDMIIRYDTEKKNNQIEVLAKENEIVKLKLRKNQTTLLISGIALALLAGIMYILYHQYQLKNEKQLLTLEQTMLRSQMNPHFLFNSLNSIKLYIINNEKKNAVHYLNKFSKLVRKILEASSLKEISLADELETVELYMNIENIRFSNEIGFEVIIEKDIDVHNIKIPSLILQPFLENALWHGLSSKEGAKNIQLWVSRENEYFTNISISDNGVGRKTAEKIKEGKVLKRKSIGIDITKERLANFSKDYQNSFNVAIVDLYDSHHNPCGTRVELRIPTI